MKSPYKLLLALALGVLVAILLDLALRRHADFGGDEQSLTLEFEPVNASADDAAIKKIIERRLLGHEAVVGQENGHIIVSIPYSAGRQQALARVQAALLEFRKAQASPAKIEAILQLAGAPREAEIKRLAPAGSTPHESLQNLVQASDALTIALARAATRPADSPAASGAVAEAQEALRRARLAFYTQRLTVERLQRVLAAADDPRDTAARDLRAELPAQYPALATEILLVIEARDAWRAAGSGGWEPEDVERLATARGIVEFRKPLAMKEIEPRALASAVDELWKRGPGMPVKVGAESAVWVQEGDGFAQEQPDAQVEAIFEGDVYLLCGDDQTLTAGDAKRDSWRVTADAPYVDFASGAASLPLNLDAVGAKYVREMMAKSPGGPLVFICDGRVVGAAPMLLEDDSSSVITWRKPVAGWPAWEMVRDAQELRQVINAGVLPGEMRRVK